MTKPNTRDQEYADYLDMIERNNFGEPMTRDQWEASMDSED